MLCDTALPNLLQDSTRTSTDLLSCSFCSVFLFSTRAWAEHCGYSHRQNSQTTTSVQNFRTMITAEPGHKSGTAHKQGCAANSACCQNCLCLPSCRTLLLLLSAQVSALALRTPHHHSLCCYLRPTLTKQADTSTRSVATAVNWPACGIPAHYFFFPAFPAKLTSA